MAPTWTREVVCFCGPPRWGLSCCGFYTKCWDNPPKQRESLPSATWEWRNRRTKQEPNVQPGPVEAAGTAEEEGWRTLSSETVVRSDHN